MRGIVSRLVQYGPEVQQLPGQVDRLTRCIEKWDRAENVNPTSPFLKIEFP